MNPVEANRTMFLGLQLLIGSLLLEVAVDPLVVMVVFVFAVFFGLLSLGGIKPKNKSLMALFEG